MESKKNEASSGAQNTESLHLNGEYVAGRDVNIHETSHYDHAIVYHIHLHVLAGKPLGWPPYTENMKQHVE